MTPEQLRLVQRSFAAIEPFADRIGTSFYARLFEMTPQIRPHSDLQPLQRALMSFLGQFATRQLRSLLTLPVTAGPNPEVSIPGIAALAQQHAQYGIGPEHFAAAPAALFWSFEQHTGQQLDHETADAWSAAFDVIATSMARVMRSDAKAPSLPRARGRSVEDARPVSFEALFRQ